MNAVRVAILAGIAMAAVLHGAAQEQDRTNEYRVKAAMIYNFTKFIEWPASFGVGGKTNLAVALVGGGTYAEIVAATLAGKQSGAMAIEIEKAADADALLASTRRYHVVYVFDSVGRLRPDAVSRLGQRALLVIGETQGFCEEGGTIGLRLEDNKTRFDINVTAVRNADLKISSKLLKLAGKIIEATPAVRQSLAVPQ